MSHSPLISVCINCYNAEDTIEAAVRSALDQTYSHLQVIVVDDCSTDRTWEILQTLSDDRLECHRLAQNGHISNANNEALRHVKGEFVAHLDADDVWYPEKLERQIAFLLEHAEYGACFTLVDMVDETGAPAEDDHRFRAENRDRAALMHHFIVAGNYLCHSSMLARREIMEQVGEHDVTLLYFHDFDYWVRMAMITDLYILDEKLLSYRISTGSNSAMTPQKKMVHIHEFARIAYQSILHCPDDLFLEAFADTLRLQGEHTHEQTELEKAFYLCHAISYLPHNSLMGLRRLCELLCDKTYVDVARRDFHFTVHDLYKMEETANFYDEITQQQTARYIAGLEEQIAALTAETNAQSEQLRRLEHERSCLLEHNRQLQEAHDLLVTVRDSLTAHAAALEARAVAAEAAHADAQAQLSAAHAHIAALDARAVAAEAAHTNAVNQIGLMTSSVSWRVTKPLRGIKMLQRIVRSSRHPMTRDGRAAACKVMLYGYYGHNFGDDLFFDTLFKRYPDTVFVAYDAVGYEAPFAPYPNVYVYQKDHSFARVLDRLGAAFKKRDAFESWLVSQTDAVVHIGGSIYQQIGTWEEDLRLREKRHSPKRPFFSVSSNFGPFSTDDYRACWHKRFSIARDICMRDTYSKDLFADLPAVRYAPDLLFAHPLPHADLVEGRLFLSVLDPASPAHGFSEEDSRRYMETVIALTRRWLESGRDVVLSSFCAFQQDDVAVQRIVDNIPDALRGGISVVNYNGDGAFDPLLAAIVSSQYVLATRFHATLFGLSAGKAVVPITYNQKVNYMLQDLGFDGYTAAVSDLDADVLYERLLSQTPFDVQAQKEAAAAQFDRLDAYIRQKGGIVLSDDA